MKLISLTLLSVSALSALVNASPLFDQLRIFTSTSETERRLVKYSEDSPARWMTEADKEALIRAGIKFMDITDYPSTSVNSFANWVPYIPTKVEYKDEVQPFIGNLTTETMKDVLTTFTSFRNRYYKSQYGAQSCRWLIEQIREIASGYDHVSVDEFEHNWDQFSIVARFEGSNQDLENELVIVGAHQDSVNSWFPYFGRSPGADDDGSGTVTILEAFRSLVHNGFKPERPVEFHWYSGEEGGLLESGCYVTK
ncbi:hypothetical protein G6F35_010466 [Rhizopus arrhizus]|nr:hypothetical protein G6F35_010466 [Rhizopus arrhizus]